MSPPMTETKPALTSNLEAAIPIKVAAPPNILSVLPNGVSIWSKATVPTTNKLIYLFLIIFINLMHKKRIINRSLLLPLFQLLFWFHQIHRLLQQLYI